MKEKYQGFFAILTALSAVTLLIIVFICLGTISIYGQNKKVIDRLNSIQEEVKVLKVIVQSDFQRVRLTSYHPKSGGTNSDSNPNKTALMTTPRAGYTLAISTELVNLGWLGKKIYVDGWGIGRAEDRMNVDLKGKRIDICSPTLKHAKKFGVKKDRLAIVL